jgi:DNA-binding transcriptional LysR family regulator
MSRFTVVGLLVVREAARHGSFSVAAGRLGYTQSAVSRQVALMERAAGRPLFERQAHGVVPTEAGRVLLRHAEVVLAELESARHGLDTLGTRAAGRIRVGAYSTAMAALVPRAIGAFARTRPGTTVSLREGQSPGLLSAVARGRVDLAVVTPPAQPSTAVHLIRLPDDPLFVAVPREHPLAGRASVAASELEPERWIAATAEPDSTLLGAWTGSSWQPEVALVARDWMAKLGLVAAGLGITVVPGLAVAVLPPGLAVVRIDDPAATRAVAIARRDPSTDHLDAFVEALRDVAAHLAAEVRHRLRSTG